MGKGLFIVLASTIFVMVTYTLSSNQAALETNAEQSDFEEKIIAREIAQSAYNSAVSEVRRDFENWRDAKNNRSYQGGAFDLSVAGPADGPVDVAVEGRFGKARYRIEGQLIRTLGDFLEPLLIDADTAEVDNVGDAFTVSGLDNRPPSEGGGSGYGPDAHALRAPARGTWNNAVANLPADRVYGTGGTGDIVRGASPYVDLDALFTDVLTMNLGNVYAGNQTFEGNETFGSPVSPTVVKVFGSVELADNVKGYGVLFVMGSLVMRGNAAWEGLILVRNPALVQIRDLAKVYGSVVARGNGGADPGLPGGHFDVDVFSSATSKEDYHEHEYDDKYDVTYVDLMTSGCGKSGDGSPGGLCWGEIIGENFDQLRVEFFNAGSSSGQYIIQSGDEMLMGKPQDGFQATVDPRDISQFFIIFDSLESMRPTKPGSVQNDVKNRDQAFAVRMYDPSTDELVYELAVYWHYDGKGGKEGSGTPISVSVGGQSKVIYSNEALMRLEHVIPAIEDAIDVMAINTRTKASDLSN